MTLPLIFVHEVIFTIVVMTQYSVNCHGTFNFNCLLLQDKIEKFKINRHPIYFFYLPKNSRNNYVYVQVEFHKFYFVTKFNSHAMHRYSSNILSNIYFKSYVIFH